jgi:chorismate--pyruvate lyase
LPDLSSISVPLNHWQGAHQLAGCDVPADLQPWLLDRGSLTRRLVELSGGDFHVEPVSQQWARPLRNERLLLKLPDTQVAWVREVILYGKGKPWVFARSVIPVASIEGGLRYLKRLGTRPLGALLFSDPTMERGAIQIAPLEPDTLPVETREPCWGRRSVFYLSGKPLLVSEVFLPEFTGSSR